MRKNVFKRWNVCILLVMLGLLIFSGCQQENILSTKDQELNYLSLKSKGKIDFDKLSDGDRMILFKAFSRINFNWDEDGIVHIRQTSGAQANMSENLFNFFKDVERSSNEEHLFFALKRAKAPHSTNDSIKRIW